MNIKVFINLRISNMWTRIFSIFVHNFKSEYGWYGLTCWYKDIYWLKRKVQNYEPMRMPACCIWYSYLIIIDKNRFIDLNPNMKNARKKIPGVSCCRLCGSQRSSVTASISSPYIFLSMTTLSIIIQISSIKTAKPMQNNNQLALL